MKTKTLKIISKIVGIVLIINVLSLALVIMVPRENTIKLSRYEYPFFMSVDIKKVETATSPSQLSDAQIGLKVAMSLNIVVIFVLLLITYIIISSKLNDRGIV